MNTKLQLHDVRNLRVIGLLIAPHDVTGNTNQVTMLIAFKGAPIICSD